MEIFQFSIAIRLSENKNSRRLFLMRLSSAVDNLIDGFTIEGEDNAVCT